MSQFNMTKFLKEGRLPDGIRVLVDDLREMIDDYAGDVESIIDDAKSVKDDVQYLRRELGDVTKWQDTGMSEEVESAQQRLKELKLTVDDGMQTLNKMLKMAQSLEKALDKLPVE